MALREKRRYCPLFGKCGGCEYVNDEYEEELSMKEVQLYKLLERYGRIERIIGADPILNYRDKIQAVCSIDREGKFTTGIYRRGTHRVIPIRNCILENGKATAILQTVRQMANRLGIKSYNEDYNFGDIRHVVIRVGEFTGEIMVTLVVSDMDFPHKSDFISLLKERHPEITTICLIKNTDKTSMVIPDNPEVKVVCGPGYITERLFGLKFRISPTSFFQVNPSQTRVLYGVAMEMASLRPDDIVVDAYSGTGTISLIAAKNGVRKVIGIENNGEAVRDAEINRNLNYLDNVEFVNADASKYMKEMAKNGDRIDVLFMDPPRSGATEEFLASANRLSPEAIVYISCNPETLSRDLRYVRRFMDYRIEAIQPVDMFPGTSHIETVVLLLRDERRHSYR